MMRRRLSFSYGPPLHSVALRGMAPCDDVQDLSLKRVNSLKRLIAAAGLEYYDCLDILELRERAKEALAAGKSPPGAERTLSSDLGRRCASAVGEEHTLAEAQRTQVVRIPQLLNDDDISAIHALAARLGVPGCSPQARHRSGMWGTTYLSAGGAFRAALPGLYAKLISAAREVDAEHWGVLQRAKGPVVPRVVEYHRVQTHGSLPWLHHFDEGSLITIDAMLSGTEDFEGGTFQTLEPDNSLKAHEFERGDVPPLGFEPRSPSPAQNAD
eukprot:6142986-Prymnesium_polylepis.2